MNGNQTPNPRKPTAPGMSEMDVTRVRLWCERRVPPHARHQVRVEAEVTDRHITIVECREPWNGRGDWTRRPIARLRFTKTTGLWTLYWRDQNLKFHSYADRLAPTQHVVEILEYLDSGVDPIFFG